MNAIHHPRNLPGHHSKNLLFYSGLIMLIVLTLCIGVAGADSIRYESVDDHLIVASVGKNQQKITIPAQYEGHDVTGIAPEAFKDAAVRQIVLPNTITHLEGNPFAYCENLYDIAVSDDHPAFASINGVLFSKEERKLLAFPRNSNIKAYVIPDGIKSIGAFAFRYCLLESIALPDSLETIEPYGLALCHTQKFMLSSKHPAFEHKSGLLIHKQTKTLVGSSDETSKNLNIPNGILEIAPYALGRGCSLVSVTVPASVKTIGEMAFWGQEHLDSVTFRNGCESIGDRAFYACDRLKSILLPDTVQSVGFGLFMYDSWLKELKLPKNLKDIPNRFCEGCSSLKHVVLPEKLEAIGLNAFNSCRSLEQIIFPKSLITIGINAFAGCSTLKSLEIPGSVQTIEGGAFAHCSGLSKVVIQDGVHAIGANAFAECSGLMEVSIPASVNEIGENAFSECPEIYLNVQPESFGYEYAKANRLSCNLDDIDRSGNNTTTTNMDWLTSDSHTGGGTDIKEVTATTVSGGIQVFESPSKSSSTLVSLKNGREVTIVEVVRDTKGSVWYHIRVDLGTKTITGFVEESSLSF